MAIVVGYPVTDQQLDLAYETESAELWEKQNSQDEAWNKALEAVGYLNPAIESMNNVTDLLINAKDEISGLDAEYRLGSLIDEYEELICEFERLRKRFIEGDV